MSTILDIYLEQRGRMVQAYIMPTFVSFNYEGYSQALEAMLKDGAELNQEVRTYCGLPYFLKRDQEELIKLGSSCENPPLPKLVEVNDNRWHLPSVNEGLRLARLCNGHATPHDIAEGKKNVSPTDDAYMRACRALNWRNAELRFYGLEPIALPDDAPHYPPDDFDFGAAHDGR